MTTKYKFHVFVVFNFFSVFLKWQQTNIRTIKDDVLVFSRRIYAPILVIFSVQRTLVNATRKSHPIYIDFFMFFFLMEILVGEDYGENSNTSYIFSSMKSCS